MKRMLFAFIIATVFLLNVIVPTYILATDISTDTSLPAPTDRSAEFYATQNESVSAFNQILNSFAESSPSTINATERIQRNYPNYYGGAYINSETGELIVLINESVASIATAAKNIDAIVQKNTNIEYKSCNVSYNELVATIYLVADLMPQFEEQGINITSVREDVKESTVIVSIENISPAKKLSVLNHVNRDYIRFENTDSEKLSASTNELSIVAPPSETTPASTFSSLALGGGTRVRNMSTGLDSTLCFAATRNGIPGFVVSAHAVPLNGYMLYSGTNQNYFGSLIGQVSISGLNSNSIYAIADAAFIQANANFTTTNKLANGGVIWSASSNYVLPVDTTVCIFGAASGLQTGTIEAIEVAYTDDGYRFSNQCYASYYSQEGDSGAPVLYYEGNYGGESKYSLVGIHRGRFTGVYEDEFGSWQVNWAAFSPYPNIVRALGITCIVS